jgi:hypothetical protein
MFTPLLAFSFDEHRPWTYQLWDLEAQLLFYNATANYSRSGGSFDRLPSGNSYQLLTTDLRARYVLTRSLALSGGLQIAYAESKNSITTRTNSSITEVNLNLETLLSRSKNYDLITDFTAVMPVEKVSTSDDKVLTGEGAMQLGGRFLARARWGFLRPFLFFGYLYRDGGRASQVPYGLGSEIKMGRSFFGAEVRGFQSLSKDDFTDTPSFRENVSSRNGDALRFFTVNPHLLETNLWWRMQPLKGVGIKILGGSSITGSATAAGWNVGATLNYRFSGEAPESKSVIPQQHNFEIPTEDGVDQSLFEEAAPQR